MNASDGHFKASVLTQTIKAVALVSLGFAFASYVAADPVRVKLSAVPIEARIDVPAGPGWLGVGFGSVWLSKSKSHAVYRIDPLTNKVIAKISVGHDPELGMVAALGSIWIPDTKDQSLSQIDPASNRVVRKIPAEFSNDPEGSIAILDGSAWFISDRGGTNAGTLVNLNLSSGNVDAEIFVPPHSHAVEAAFGAVWVTSSGAGQVIRVDPLAAKVVGTIDVHAKPRFMASGFGSLWVLSQSDGSLARIDPRKNEVISTFLLNVPGPGGDLATDDTHVWISAEGTPISFVDPSTNSTRVQVTGGHKLDTLRVGFGSLWLVDENHGILRFATSKLESL